MMRPTTRRFHQPTSWLDAAALLAPLAMAVAALAGCSAPEGGPSARISRLLADMTLEEKIGMLHGTTDPDGASGAGYLAGVPRLGVPPLRLADGPAGIRTRQPATAAAGSRVIEVGASSRDIRLRASANVAR